MGWNQGYEIFEATVVGTYDLGMLSLDLLKILMEPYRDTDIDSGGSRYLRAKDGLGVEEIVVKLCSPEKFSVLEPVRQRVATYPTDYDAMSDLQAQDAEDYSEALGDCFNEITDAMFGWR